MCDNFKSCNMVQLDYTKFTLPQTKPASTETVDACRCARPSTDPSVWGPCLWRYMHYSAINFPEFPTKRQATAMAQWLYSLPVTIPCEKCRHHYAAYIKKHARDLVRICSSRKGVFNFLVDIHNKVNERNGKPVMSYADAIEFYENMKI